jgi:hypothetical protein
MSLKFTVCVPKVSSEILANVSVYLTNLKEEESSDSEYEDVDDANDNEENEKSGTHSQLLLTNPTIATWRAVLSDRTVTLSLSNSLAVLLEMFVIAINSAADPSVSNNSLTADRLVDVIDCVDRLASCSANILAMVPPRVLSLPSKFNSESAVVGDNGSLDVSVEVLQSIPYSPTCTSLFKDLLTLFTRTVDRMIAFDEFLANKLKAVGEKAAPEEPVQVEMIDETGLNDEDGAASGTSKAKASQVAAGFIGDDEFGFVRSTLAQTMASVVNGISCLLRASEPIAQLATVLDRQDAMLMQALCLALSKGVMHSDDQTSSSCLQTVNILAAKENEAEASQLGACSIVSDRLNALLSNAVGRRLDAGIEKMTACCSRNAVNVSDLSEVLRVLDTAFMTIIELHTSDNPHYLHNFTRLQIGNRLVTSAPAVEKVLSTVEKLSKTNKAVQLIDKGFRRKLRETLENVSSFIEYKKQSITAASGARV